MKAYMDDIVVKTKDRATLVQDLEETFANFRKINLKLNPEKCVFGVPSGSFLGFLCRNAGSKQIPTRSKQLSRLRRQDGSKTSVGSPAALLP